MPLIHSRIEHLRGNTFVLVMALVPYRPGSPAGLIDSLQGTRSLGYSFFLPTPLNPFLQTGRYVQHSCPIKFQCFSSHGTLNVENSEYPQSGDSQKKKQMRFRDRARQAWSVRPSVHRKRLPWEEEESYPSRDSGPKNTLENLTSEGPPKPEKNVPFYPPSGRPLFGKGPALPTAPWMKGWNNLPKEGIEKMMQPAVDYTEDIISGESEADETSDVETDNAVETVHYNGSSRNSAMEQIVEKLKKFGYIDRDKSEEPKPEPGSIEDIFFTDSETFPNTKGGYALDGSWSAPYRVSEPGQQDKDTRYPWERQEKNSEDGNTGRGRRTRTPTLAELTIPEPDLRRLRSLGIRLKERTKVGNAGVTQAIVDSIHEKWKKSEIVKIRCEGPPATNMKRTHEILERKTGGLVIWRSGGSIVIYRGMTYEPPRVKSAKHQVENDQGVYLQPGEGMPFTSDTVIINKPVDEVDGNSPNGTLSRDKQVHMIDDQKGVDSHFHADAVNETKRVQPPGETDYETEVDKILNGLGPRFLDWSGRDPLPVDADLLPGIVPGYKQPFRLLPYRMRPTLSNNEMTKLRRLARTVPPHFALGRNRQLEGLAAAMVKLWERSSIAKIAVKRGVQNTNNERMAEELKRLTGGTLLSRNKEFIVFFRGKDFLSPDVTAALVEREAMAKALQDEEEKARLNASVAILDGAEADQVGPSIAGTLAESLEANARWAKCVDSEEKKKMIAEAAKARKAEVARRIERKLALAQAKVAKAEKALAKVEASFMPAEPSSDRETITDEERFMLRKLGLRMKAFLLLGRRGIFDGTVENMHLHWKHRELVKIISKETSFMQVKSTALMLESESGGILVSVDKLSKGYAIIVYRGKNYRRPSKIKPPNLLTKRKALQRSIEIQRHESLTRHILQLERNIELLKFDLSRMEDVADNEGISHLNAELHSAYPSEDLESEDEGAYIESYNSYSENEEPSLELQSDTVEMENGEIGEENAADTEFFGMDIENDLMDSSEAEEGNTE